MFLQEQNVSDFALEDLAQVIEVVQCVLNVQGSNGEPVFGSPGMKLYLGVLPRPKVFVQ